MMSVAPPVTPAKWRDAFGKPAPGAPLVSFKDIHLGFEEGDVLRGVSFDVWPGETKTRKVSWAEDNSHTPLH